MSNWHINNKGEVHPCRARPGHCRFGGTSGKENHFSSKEQAEKISAQSAGSFSILGTQRKRINIGKANTDTIKAVSSLVERGVSVSSVATLDRLPLEAKEHSEVDILEDDIRGLSLQGVRRAGRPF